MINIIWFLLIFVGVVYGLLNGNDIGSIILNSSNDCYKMIVSVFPLIVLWSGIMNIANDSGLLHRFSIILKPLLNKLFPSVKNSKALDYISSNIAANMLGLGSAATPYGLKAMEELNKVNKNKEMASDAMITFLVLNTSGVTIIPMTVIGMRLAYGSINPSNIILPSIIATSVASFSGLFIDYLIRRKHE